MAWNEVYTQAQKPKWEEISAYVDSPEWEKLCGFLETTYGVSPLIEYSVCSGAPGWNVKYKKSSRSLCTIYPEKGHFTCLVSIGRKEAVEAELILNTCTPYLQNLYENTRLFNGSRWLMIDVTSEEIRRDVEELIRIRVHPPKARKKVQDTEVSEQESLETMVNGLYLKDTAKACGYLKRLQDLSKESPQVYGFLDTFIAMMEHDNSYVRTRGLALIAANAKWDSENRIDEIIDEYLKHITDMKPITARQCVQVLPELAKFKPDLRPVIREALVKADVGKYADSMQSLVQKDIYHAIKEVETMMSE